MAEAREQTAKEELESIRCALRAENISYGELARLEELRDHIDEGDIELLEAAGVPEHSEHPRGFVEAVNEYFKDHFDTFGGYPMDFEYEGKVYDFDECIRHVT
ncbi:hypothetical protein N9L75_03775 [Porticoccaceae bacterium]|nr:hypothetical protein [Porticoccaceae bacterium]MDB2343094.1 hypothetical protein [Porticoccaceae bacterium]MDB2664391.1 hypothetical protein [Porticoccaceae bacterium]